MDWVDRPQNYKAVDGILQPLQSSHVVNFPLTTLKLGWITFHSIKFQLKCFESSHVFAMDYCCKQK